MPLCQGRGADVRNRPRPLRKGSRVAVIAPSSPAPREELEEGLDALRGLGFEPVPGQSCGGSTPARGYLAAESDSVKLADLHWAFRDPRVDGIVCLRGGSGAGRLIRHIDPALVAANPKVFVGYSDITILHAFLAEKCNLLTFHGPMATSKNLISPGPSRDSFLRALTDPAPLGEFHAVEDGRACLVPGKSGGEFTGGNLAVLCTTLGTDCELRTKDKIVLLEDVDEEPYSVDRMLNHLLNAGKLSDAAGIVLGDFTNCKPPKKPASASFRTVRDVIEDVLVPLGIPLMAGLPAGHGGTNLTLPLGIPAEMDAEAGVLRFASPALIKDA